MTLVAFEGIAVATALPVAARDLGGLGGYAWAFTAYVAASLVGMVTAGTHCDRHGPRASVVAGVTAFGSGAAVAGLAGSMAVLVAGRAVQGLGGGAAIVGVYVLIARAFDESLRPRAFTLLAAAWVVPALVGPAVAGWLADAVSWRVVFLLVPVFVLPPAVLLLPVLSRYAVGDAAGAVRPGRTRAALASAAGLALAADGLMRIGSVGPVGVAESVAGVVLLVITVGPLLPPGTLRLARGLPTTVAMRGWLAGAFFAAEAFVPLALIEQRDLGTTAAGSVLTAAAAGWMAGSLTQSRLPGDRDRSGVVRTGAILCVAATATLPLCLLPAVPAWSAGVSWLIGSVGMGLAFPSISVQTLRLSADADQGLNSSALQLCDAIGSVLVLGVAGAVHAAAVAAGGATDRTYTGLWLLSAGLLLGAAAAAGRMRPAAG